MPGKKREACLMSETADKIAKTTSPAIPPTGLYIAGAWRDTGAFMDVRNPADGSTVAKVASGGAADARAALDAAVEAQTSWRNMPPRTRTALFYKAHALMMTRAEDFARLMTLESGKPLTESRAEFGLSADFLLWFTEQIAHVHGTYAPSSHGGFRIVTTHQPVGPCLLITPWNFPLLMIVRKAGGALAAGCTAIVKSAQETPLTAALFTQILHEAGFPAGVINLIHTSDASSVSKPLLRDHRLRKVSFTGSTRVGGLLLEMGSANIVNSSLELGGDGPFVVLDDADLDAAVDHAIACKFRNAGQACVAANRIIVDRNVEPEFTERFVERTRKLKVGNGLDPVDVGPMISHRQRDRLPDMIADLVAGGGRLLTGGNVVDGPGYFFEPTVIRFDGPNKIVCSNELFAPVAAIFAVDGLDEAIRFANETRYGLAAYLFTGDFSRAISLAEALEFGMVGINRGIMADPAAPFGGTKMSGLGREAGHGGIYEFLEEKYMALTVNDPFSR
jgi:succinate-semialdehyde dehydrogenase/glutarate-semialdehyde dehydrogenase